MRKIANGTALLLLVAAGCTLSGCVELKDAGRTVGHTSKEVAKDIGHASRDVAEDISRGTKRVVREIAKED